jgi:UDP-N-acetylglucosamine:LPS N-acetylglucosamine transferase
VRAAGDALDYRLVGYEEHMDALYAGATLVVSRSGGMTAELAVVGMPAVLVPLPGAPGDHQARNADAFLRAGAAVVVPDDELDGERLASELDRLLGSPRDLAAMSAAARTLARSDAAASFADLVEEVARDAG